MLDDKYKTKVTKSRIDRERGRTSGVRRQRRQPGAINRHELLLQDQHKKKLEKYMSEDYWLDALLSITRTNPGLYNTQTRQRAFEKVREL